MERGLGPLLGLAEDAEQPAIEVAAGLEEEEALDGAAGDLDRVLCPGARDGMKRRGRIRPRRTETASPVSQLCHEAAPTSTGSTTPPHRRPRPTVSCFGIYSESHTALFASTCPWAWSASKPRRGRPPRDYAMSMHALVDSMQDRRERQVDVYAYDSGSPHNVSRRPKWIVPRIEKE